MYRLALDHKARQIVLIAGILLAASLLALFLHRSAFAQDNGPIEYAEGSKDVVATFTASDPEDDTITWSVTDTDGGVLDFKIGRTNGVLEFTSAPDFEDPKGGASDDAITYNATVTATSDDGAGSTNTDTYSVSVKLTDVPEDGEVSWTVDPDGGATHTPGTPKLTQFQVDASVMASVEDGDISGATKTVVATHTDVPAAPIWRWYRSPDKVSDGTEISGATTDTYTVTPADVGMYLRVVAIYRIAGNVDQETASLTSDYPVLAARVGANKLKFDPSALKRSVAEGKKGASVGDPVTATGGHGAVNYTLGDATTGVDNDRFKVDQKTGQITTNVDFNSEGEGAATASPAAAGSCAEAASGSPDTECIVTVRATDASGSATAAAASAGVFVDATVTITLTDVNEKPGSFTGMETITRPENLTALADTGSEADVTYTATDPEGRNLTYRLMGLDASKFQLSAARVLSFKEAPDFEEPGDSNRDNVYQVTVRASDGVTHADRMVTVTVTDANDDPKITKVTTPINYPENGKNPVVTFKATDQDGDTITWSVLSTGREDFKIGSSDGKLEFLEPPDYENPGGGAGDDSTTYTVTVTATSPDGAGGTNDDTFELTVKVTKVAEEREGYLDRGSHRWGGSHPAIDAVPGRRDPDGQRDRWRYSNGYPGGCHR